ncbi:flippase-like domain-containing protein [Halobaculum rubrum]|uniref:flippase-like domain-containing protein n=1 Tax=Halobaculum rubrum TaxID=2872158 RepID=UPI001CA3E05E|nr:flippase-like domain-containing protein [Halobaculum rubrum]QZX99895.1 flippase-like domain-containing protein [Halobaculum rubrum]
MEISVVVPAHNEAGNVERLVEAVTAVLDAPSFEHEYELLLVDDNSTDETPTICDRLAQEHPGVRVLHRTADGGFGNAIKAGLTKARGDVLIPFMGDLSDDPADIPKLVAAIEDGYDVAYGSRFTEGGSVDGYPRIKLLYNRAFNNCIRLLFGVRSKDVTNAFTAYRREVVETVDVDTLVSESFDLTAELPLRAHIEGFRSTEVPVSWCSRDAGVSKLDATRKGPLYLKRLLHMFVIGNAVALSDLWDAVSTGSPLRMVGASLLGVLILVGLFSLSGYEEVFSILAGTQPAWLLVAAGAYGVSFLFRTWRYRVLLRTSGHLASRGGVFRCIMSGWFVNFILPARVGDAVRGLALKTTEGVPFGVATGMVAIERALDMLVLGFGMVAITLFLLPEAEMGLLAGGAFAIAAVIVFGLFVLYRFEPQLARLLGKRFPAAGEAIAALVAALEQTVKNPFALTLAAALSVPVWAFEVSTIYFSAIAIGVDIGPVVTATAGIAAFVAQAVPATPAGIGTYEATITAVLAGFDLPSSQGTALALVDHFVRVALVYVVGAISLVHIGFRSRAYFRERDAETDADTDVASAVDAGGGEN